MADWFYPVLYTLIALGIGTLCLPIALSLHLRRDGLPAAWQILVQLAIFRGGLGVGVRLDPQHRLVVPVLLGKSLTFPSFSLRSTPRPKIKKEEADNKDQPPQTPTAEQETKPRTKLLAMLRLLLKPGLAFLASLPRTFGLKHLRITGRLGFADPAQTGVINGYLQAVKYLKNKLIQIDISPDFTRPGAFGQLELVAHVHLGVLLLLLGRFGLQVGYRFVAVRLFGWKPNLI